MRVRRAQITILISTTLAIRIRIKTMQRTILHVKCETVKPTTTTMLQSNENGGRNHSKKNNNKNIKTFAKTKQIINNTQEPNKIETTPEPKEEPMNDAGAKERCGRVVWPSHAGALSLAGRK